MYFLNLKHWKKKNAWKYFLYQTIMTKNREFFFLRKTDFCLSKKMYCFFHCKITYSVIHFYSEILSCVIATISLYNIPYTKLCPQQVKRYRVIVCSNSGHPALLAIYKICIFASNINLQRRLWQIGTEDVMLLQPPFKNVLFLERYAIIIE